MYIQATLINFVVQVNENVSVGYVTLSNYMKSEFEFGRAVFPGEISVGKSTAMKRTGTAQRLSLTRLSVWNEDTMHLHFHQFTAANTSAVLNDELGTPVGTCVRVHLLNFGTYLRTGSGESAL